MEIKIVCWELIVLNWISVVYFTKPFSKCGTEFFKNLQIQFEFKFWDSDEIDMRSLSPNIYKRWKYILLKKKRFFSSCSYILK